MSNVKKTLVSDQSDLKPGDHVTVEFGGTVVDVGTGPLGGVTINHGETEEWTSEVYLGYIADAIANPSHVTVEKVSETPEFELNQIWEDPDTATRFAVYFAAVPRMNKLISLSSGSVYDELSFHNLFPKAELVLDA